MPNSNDPEIRAIIAAMDEKTRKEWDIMRDEHETRLQDERGADAMGGMSEKEQNDRQAVLRPKLEAIERVFIDDVKDRIERENAPASPQVAKPEIEVEFRDAPLPPPPVSRFMLQPEPMEQPPLEQTVQPEVQSRFIGAQEQSGPEPRITAEEQHRINEEADRQIGAAQARGDLEPVTFERHVAADAGVFEARRQDVRDFCQDELKKELDKTLEGVNDPEVRVDEQSKIEDRWARDQADQIARINREEAERLERTQQLYFGKG